MARRIIEEQRVVTLKCGDIEMRYDAESEDLTIGNGSDDDMNIVNRDDLLDLKAVVDAAVERNFFNEKEDK